MSAEPTTDLLPAAEAVGTALDRARTGLVDREVLVDVVVLCAVAGEHALVVGPPGTAKSEAIRRVAQEVGGRYFEYLVGRFTEPHEIFGPVDLTALREGRVEVATAGMLPEADIAFLDEVFLGSTAILNSLLGLLNERVYRRGSTVVHSPLRVCVGACNMLPEDTALAAFADRFLVRVFVDQVPDARLEELLETGWAGARHDAGSPVDLRTSLDELGAAVPTVDVSGVSPTIAAAVRRLRAAGVTLSDRRVVRAQRLVAAAAVLDGRTRASGADLWVLPLVAPTADGQAVAGEVLRDLIGAASNRGVPHAAELLSRGPRARADRMARDADLLLTALDATIGPIGSLGLDDRHRVEALLREVDAGFAGDDLPDDLRQRRDRLVALLSP